MSPRRSERRARRRRFDAATGTEGRSELLSFMLADEEYAVELLRVREILRWRAPTEVPRAPAVVEGVISVRGVIVPVLDIRKRLSLASAPPGKQTRIVVVTRGGEPYGIIVDEIGDVVRALPTEVEPPPALLSGAGIEYLAGIWRPAGERQDTVGAAVSGGRMVILLALDRVLEVEITGRGGVTEVAETGSVGGVAGLIDAVIGPESPIGRRG